MHLLIVEDDSTIAEHIQKHFQAGGYVTNWVSTCAAALETALVDEYDCIILDRKLPDGEGMEVCRELRRRSNNTPVLVLSALAQIEERVEGLELGADDYLVKPFAMDELQARVQSLIRRNSLKNAPNLKIRNIELDSARRCLFVDGLKISVSNKEFLIVEYLMRNAGRALNRSQILEHVWGFHHEGETNLVDVYVNYIRNKIDKPNSDKSNIETFRGYGYRFRDET